MSKNRHTIFKAIVEKKARGRMIVNAPEYNYQTNLLSQYQWLQNLHLFSSSSEISLLLLLNFTSYTVVYSGLYTITNRNSTSLGTVTHKNMNPKFTCDFYFII